MESQCQPEADQIKGFSPASQALFQQWTQLELNVGTLYHQFESQNGSSRRLHLIVPKGLKEEVLRQFMKAILVKTKHRINNVSDFYWPGHQKDVATWCRTCIRIVLPAKAQH